MCGSFGRGWVTGFLEGEGSFIARKASRGAWEVGMQASSTDRDDLVKLRKYIGGKLYGPYKQRGPNHRPYWQWRLYGQPRIARVLRWMKRHLSKRRRKQVGKMQQVLKHRRWERGWTPSAE